MSSTSFPTREERAAGLREWVADTRKRGVSLRDVAKRLGVSKGAIQGLLGGAVPQDDTLLRMEAAMIRTEHNAAMQPDQGQDASDLERRLDEIAERAGANPIYWTMQVEALAAAYRGVALGRVSEALSRAEGASEKRAEGMQPLAPVLGLDQLPPERPAKKRGGQATR